MLLPLDSEQSETVDEVYHKMILELPYDSESNELIAEAVRAYMAEHPSSIAEFKDIVLKVF